MATSIMRQMFFQSSKQPQSLMMFAWFKNIWILISRMNCYYIPYSTMMAFSITFRATVKPDDLYLYYLHHYLVKKTCPYLPLPKTFIFSKLSKERAFWFFLFFADCLSHSLLLVSFYSLGCSGVPIFFLQKCISCCSLEISGSFLEVGMKLFLVSCVRSKGESWRAGSLMRGCLRVVVMGVCSLLQVFPEQAVDSVNLFWSWMELLVIQLLSLGYIQLGPLLASCGGSTSLFDFRYPELLPFSFIGQYCGFVMQLFEFTCIGPGIKFADLGDFAQFWGIRVGWGESFCGLQKGMPFWMKLGGKFLGLEKLGFINKYNLQCSQPSSSYLNPTVLICPQRHNAQFHLPLTLSPSSNKYNNDNHQTNDQRGILNLLPFTSMNLEQMGSPKLRLISTLGISNLRSRTSSQLTSSNQGCSRMDSASFSKPRRFYGFCASSFLMRSLRRGGVFFENLTIPFFTISYSQRFVSALQGGLPTQSSYSTTPYSYQSTILLCPRLLIISKGIQAGVPQKDRFTDSMLSIFLESPKSVISTCPSLSTTIFSGFKSRQMILYLWSASRASKSSHAQFLTSFQVNLLLLCSNFERSPPSQQSITKNRCQSVWKANLSLTMNGWSTRLKIYRQVFMYRQRLVPLTLYFFIAFKAQRLSSKPILFTRCTYPNAPSPIFLQNQKSDSVT